MSQYKIPKPKTRSSAAGPGTYSYGGGGTMGSPLRTMGTDTAAANTRKPGSGSASTRTASKCVCSICIYTALARSLYITRGYVSEALCHHRRCINLLQFPLDSEVCC